MKFGQFMKFLLYSLKNMAWKLVPGPLNFQGIPYKKEPEEVSYEYIISLFSLRRTALLPHYKNIV